MLLGNPDIKHAVGESCPKNIHACAARHSGGDADDFIIAFGLLDELASEDISIARRIGNGFTLLARYDVKLGHAVILIGGVFSWGIAFTLLRHNMDKDRAVLHIFHVLEYGDESVQIMSINRADIVKTKFFKPCSAHKHAARIFFGFAGRVFNRTRRVFDNGFACAA